MGSHVSSTKYGDTSRAPRSSIVNHCCDNLSNRGFNRTLGRHIEEIMNQVVGEESVLGKYSWEEQHLCWCLVVIWAKGIVRQDGQCHPQRTASDSTELERMCVYMCMHMCEGRMRRWQRHRQGLGKDHFKNQAEGIYSLSRRWRKATEGF